jgi:hypothetical protein
MCQTGNIRVFYHTHFFIINAVQDIGIGFMEIEKLLTERKTAISRKWFEQVTETYPSDTSKFLKQQKDPFANPVGSTTMNSLLGVLDELLKKEPDKEKLVSHLDPVIRIRTVQAVFTPSQAVGFVFFLKQIVRENLKNECRDLQTLTALSAFEGKVDELALIAFNIYMECTKTILELKANHEKGKVYRAFSRAGLVEEIPDDGPELIR